MPLTASAIAHNASSSHLTKRTVPTEDGDVAEGRAWDHGLHLCRRGGHGRATRRGGRPGPRCVPSQRRRTVLEGSLRRSPCHAIPPPPGRRRLTGPHGAGRLRRLLPRSRQGLAPRTVAYIGTILHRALDDAVRWGRLVRNPADAVKRPKVPSASSTVTAWDAANARGLPSALALVPRQSRPCRPVLRPLAVAGDDGVTARRSARPPLVGRRPRRARAVGVADRHHR